MRYNCLLNEGPQQKSVVSKYTDNKENVWRVDECSCWDNDYIQNLFLQETYIYVCEMAVTKHAEACSDGKEGNTVFRILCIVAAYMQRLCVGMERLENGRMIINW